MTNFKAIEKSMALILLTFKNFLYIIFIVKNLENLFENSTFNLQTEVR